MFLKGWEKPPKDYLPFNTFSVLFFYMAIQHEHNRCAYSFSESMSDSVV